MSHRSAVSQFADHGHAHGCGRASPQSESPRRAARPAGRSAMAGARCASARWRSGPSSASLVVMAGWSAVTATYFAFRDDVLTRLLARQAQMQYAYEDRIAELRGQVDRLASRQLLDQEQVESKLEQIARRQATLESRSSALSGIARSRRRPARSSRRRAPARRDRSLPQAAPKPSPINDTVILVPPPEREARLESRNPLNAGVRLAAAPASAGIEGALARLQVSLDRYEAEPGQDAQHAGRELRRQGAPDARHPRRSRPRPRQDRARPARARDRRPVRAGERRAASRPSTASSIASSSCAGRSSG